MRVCLHCSNNIEHKRANAKFCSQFCKDSFRYKNKEWSYEKQTTCLECGLSLEGKLRNAKYCSKNCKDKKFSLDKYKKHYSENKEYYLQKSTIRQRTVKQAIPKWANKDDLKNVYLEAKYFGMQVDHIIPLNHPLVCGLHVWDNLQLLSQKDNAKKSNKFIIQ